jgi:hypothetical protein
MLDHAAIYDALYLPAAVNGSVEVLPSSNDAPARNASVLDTFRVQGDALAANLY